jgi:hypothetical protein
MTAGCWKTYLTTALVALFAARVARADVTGTWSGQMAGKKMPESMDGAAVFTQTGKVLSGTIALGAFDATLGGAFLVHGKATAKKLTVSGTNNVGATIKWTGKISGGALAGNAKVRLGSQKAIGKLSLTTNPPVADGSSCDAVYQQNATQFHDQVLETSLVACQSCHVDAGQAASTRFRVTVSDPLATARSMVPFIDPTNPTASRILEKPLGLVPHGGMQQIVPGSTEEQNLTQWVDLIVAAHCN